jgi:hypothetical protein
MEISSYSSHARYCHAVPAHAPVYTRWLIKTVLFCTETRSVVVTQRRFHAHFQTRWVASFKTIHKLCNQFNNDGSVLERKRRRPSSVRSLESIDAVRVALQRSPGKSTREICSTTGGIQTIGAMNIEK